jgi:DNA-directed RNA polymerase beta' subunit
LIIEQTNVGIYVDPIIIKAIDAIEMLVSIDKNFHDQNHRVKENRTAKAISKLSDFYEMFFSANLSPKSGQFRRHVFGTRTNFSFRAVITSLTDTHDYDEIHVPWGIGLTAFRPHLLSKLMKMGMDINSAIGLLLGHVEKYHPLLDKLLQELIAEAPGGSIHVLLQRNFRGNLCKSLKTKIAQ